MLSPPASAQTSPLRPFPTAGREDVGMLDRRDGRPATCSVPRRRHRARTRPARPPARRSRSPPGVAVGDAVPPDAATVRAPLGLLQRDLAHGHRGGLAASFHSRHRRVRTVPGMRPPRLRRRRRSRVDTRRGRRRRGPCAAVPPRRVARPSRGRAGRDQLPPLRRRPPHLVEVGQELRVWRRLHPCCASSSCSRGGGVAPPHRRLSPSDRGDRRVVGPDSCGSGSSRSRRNWPCSSPAWQHRTAVLFPPLAAWFVIFLRSIVLTARGQVRWKGRAVLVRPERARR